MINKSLLFILFLPLNIFSQDITFVGSLIAINYRGHIVNKWDYNAFASTTIDAFETQYGGVTYSPFNVNYNLQPMLLYQAKPNITFGLGYCYQKNNPFLFNYFYEHRILQQVMIFHPVSKFTISHRLRFEERFIQTLNHNAFDLTARFRYQLGFMMPLKGNTIDKNEFFLNSNIETYINLAGPKNAVLNDNWDYLGLGYDMGKMGRVEIGYLMQIMVRNTQKNLRYFNLLQILWSMGL